MSYDLDIFLFQNDGDPKAYFEDISEKEEIEESPPVPELIEACGRLASSNLVSSTSADNDVFEDEKFGIIIEAYSSFFTLTMPYWHEGEDATAAFRKLEHIYQQINSTGTWLIYDPQEGEVKESITSGEECSEYQETVGKVEKLIGTESSKKPWWQFW